MKTKEGKEQDKEQRGSEQGIAKDINRIDEWKTLTCHCRRSHPLHFPFLPLTSSFLSTFHSSP